MFIAHRHLLRTTVRLTKGTAKQKPYNSQRGGGGTSIPKRYHTDLLHLQLAPESLESLSIKTGRLERKHDMRMQAGKGGKGMEAGVE